MGIASHCPASWGSFIERTVEENGFRSTCPSIQCHRWTESFLWVWSYLFTGLFLPLASTLLKSMKWVIQQSEGLGQNMVSRWSPCLWILTPGGWGELGSREPSPRSLAACSAVCIFPAWGEIVLISTLQMFPTLQSRHRLKWAVGYQLFGLHSPVGSLRLAAFHGRECWRDASGFVFSS